MAETIINSNQIRQSGDTSSQTLINENQVRQSGDSSSQTLLNKNQIESGGGGIPARYTQVDYIQTSRGQYSYIDTGIAVGPNIRTVTEILSNSYYQNESVFGAKENGDGYYITTFNNKWYYPATGGEGNGGSYNSSTKYEIDYNVNSIIINGTSIATELEPSFSANSNLIIACRFQNNYGNFKYYSFKVYNGNSLVRDMIPVYDTEGDEYGMYDLVSQSFFGNDGGGTITGGNEQ